VVGAALVLECLVRGLAPLWLASNEMLSRLATKLGYTRGDEYEIFEIAGDGDPAGPGLTSLTRMAIMGAGKDKEGKMRRAALVLLCAVVVFVGGCFLFDSGVLYEETWSDPDTTAWTLGDTTSATKSIEGGRYHVLVKENTTLAYWNDDEGPFSDVQIDVDVKHEAGANVDAASGLVFRLGSIDDFYLFQLSPVGSFRILKWVSAVSAVVQTWTASAAINTGMAENHLTVLADGTSLTFLINDTQVAEIVDTSLSNGYVGVSVQAWNPNVEESFDNLSVRKL
jgi:hypothetical protein